MNEEKDLISSIPLIILCKTDQTSVFNSTYHVTTNNTTIDYAITDYAITNHTTTDHAITDHATTNHATINNIIDFRYLSHFCIANIFTPALQKTVSEKECWSKGHRIAKKALSLMIQLNCDSEFFNMMDEFILSKTHELQLLKENKNDDNVESQLVVSNPFVTKC
ncbi:8957_t:CDS:1 [Cetraspora pellucida]|uniref:8957_t:CDS:1 n=1 Tax=Cetraspora pellucida TaxID=1433469 RepID=A0A9N9CXR2_9GLOM|nr:8957_t:CDS:1 [Cetraspora pellucida]